MRPIFGTKSVLGTGNRILLFDIYMLPGIAQSPPESQCDHKWGFPVCPETGRETSTKHYFYDSPSPQLSFGASLYWLHIIVP